jgi:hypothetical protein
MIAGIDDDGAGLLPALMINDAISRAHTARSQKRKIQITKSKWAWCFDMTVAPNLHVLTLSILLRNSWLAGKPLIELARL